MVLLSLGLSGVACIWVIAPNVLQTLFGVDYNVGAAPTIMILASVCMLFEALKLHHFDVPFLLKNNTFFQIPINAGGALLNLALLFIFIPYYGLVGAVYSVLANFRFYNARDIFYGAKIYGVANRGEGDS